MTQKIQDLKSGSDGKKINLKSGKSKQIPDSFIDTTKKKKTFFYKQNSPIREIRDIEVTQKNNYSYIKGKKFTPPKSLGNLLKMAFFGFIIIFIINAINLYYVGKKLEKDIAAEATTGFELLMDGGKNTSKIEFTQAIAAFEKASNNFGAAQENLWFISTDNSIFGNQNNLTGAVNALLTGGQNFARAGQYFLEAVEEFNKIPLYFVAKNQNPDYETPSLTDTLKNGLDKTDLAIKEIAIASEKILNIDENTLPLEIKNRVILAKQQVKDINDTLTLTGESFPALLKLLGDRYPHRYLILFQNNNEIRPTGGFIGSYAIMDLNEGYIEKLEVHDVYDIDGSYGGYIEPPEELKDFVGNWRFRDSNYSADFPTSAAKAKWFLEKEGGPSVDTVIAVNQGLLEDMLEITGPVQVGNFGALNSENYNLLLSYVIEGKIWGAEDPKHILKVFVPAFKEAILKEENVAKVASKLYKAIQQKHIMMYSSDQEIQRFFDSLDLSGRVYQTQEKEDYLSVINFSKSGTKSDMFTEESILHDTFIDKNGNIINEVTIKRSHKWDDSVYLEWRRILREYGFNTMPDELIDILGRGRNKVNMKIYVPAGSILLESDGEDVSTKFDKDLKKDYFSTEMEMQAGESKEITVKYRLPFTLDLKNQADIYKLIVEKQPGSRGSIFTKTVHTDPEVYNLSVYPVEVRTDLEDNLVYATNLVYDRYFSGLWARE